MESQQQTICIGRNPHQQSAECVEGQYTQLLGEEYYKISNYDRIPPFFMTLVSDSDHWMFISSSGGLSAGRQNAESALFPYYTEDRIAENAENTGDKTLLLLERETSAFLWEPFSSRYAGVYRVQRNLYKNIYGNSLVFEEVNNDLQLTFRYAWRTSDRYGLVRSSSLSNDGESACRVRLLDGLQNLLPYGVTSQTQETFSVLLDAYKRNELDKESGLGLFTLSSKLTDLAEPSESLKATTVWHCGLKKAQYLLSSQQLDAFRQGQLLQAEIDVRGRRGAFFVHAEYELAPVEEQDWHLVAELNQDSTQVAALRNELLHNSHAELSARLEADIQKGSENLNAIVGQADGLQISGDRLSATHHFSNVLFNTMRGGIFDAGYQLSKADFTDFLFTRNQEVCGQNQEFLNQLPETFSVTALLRQAAEKGSKNLERLCYEYLPLTFSRRHGDPSRPWNTFSINIKKEDGSRNLDYQGNWRDIFQNWEPLAYSYPEFVESMVCKFLNATTADGYNPYRVTRDGIEWEVPEPDNPWANIGYWGDHQIVYLLKLMESSEKFHPGRLQNMLNRRIFSHANVPYRIKKYGAILEDSYDTIDFDETLDREIAERAEEIGTDAKLLQDSNGKAVHVGLTEKLLILLLAKLSNFVPEGGIWMNTQRPEWNDANNALAGRGLSMVTLYYLRRYLVFCQELFRNCEQTNFTVTKNVYDLFQAIQAVLERFRPLLKASFTDSERRAIMDELGETGSRYRQRYYQHGVSGDLEMLSSDKLLSFLELTLEFIEHSIRANKREDGLYHAYNTLRLDEGSASIHTLYEMLEGQVAVLSSGLLSGAEALDLLQALRNSNLYREDQHSYILYPDRDLPGFLDKNCLNEADVKDSELIAMLVSKGESSLISKDVNGQYHFNGNFRNAKDVKLTLEQLRKQPKYAELAEKESGIILEIFEKHFDHQSFTGRSGTFFAYEGLGSIYWHMVSKLLLAVQENYFQVIKQHESRELIEQLAAAYYDIRSGIGFNKSPEIYGAFPTDPYSHTPAGSRARQPGMTGQVKEEILTRLGEMGLFIEDGKVRFNPVLLRKEELLKESQTFSYIDVAGEPQCLELPAGSLAYTFCQVPIVYSSDATAKVVVKFADGSTLEIKDNSMNTELSHRLFLRDGRIQQITVYTSAGR